MSTASKTASSSARNTSPNCQNRLRRTAVKQVAGPAHGLQMRRVFRVSFDLLPQSADINVHAARRHKAIAAPHGVESLVAREDLVGPRSEVIQQAELKRTEGDRLARSRHLVRRGINLQPPGSDSGGSFAC